MQRIYPILAAFALALSAAPLATAQPLLVQPASKSNEKNTELGASAEQCKTLHDDYVKRKDWLAAKPADHDSGKNKGKDDKADKLEDKDLEQMRKEYAKRCGEPPADMAALAAKPAEAGKKSDAAPVEKYHAPKKAGPAKGTHRTSSARCDQLHGALKDVLAKRAACTKHEKGCKQAADDDYEQLANAYRVECGDIPADAKPAKKKKG